MLPDNSGGTGPDVGSTAVASRRFLLLEVPKKECFLFQSHGHKENIANAHRH
jgi:hypothetical protein